MFSRRLRGLLSIAFALGALPLSVPGALAAEGLTLTTPYPAITVSPGTQATFELSIETTAPARIDLALAGAPASWTAELHGGGYVVGAVQTDGKEADDGPAGRRRAGGRHGLGDHHGHRIRDGLHGVAARSPSRSRRTRAVRSRSPPTTRPSAAPPTRASRSTSRSTMGSPRTSPTRRPARGRWAGPST